MFTDPTQVQLFNLGFAFFTATLMAFFLFVNNYKDTVARAFGVSMIFIIFWSFFGFLAHLTTENWELSRQLRVVSVAFIPPMTAALNRFAIIFYNYAMGEKQRSFKIQKAISYISALGIVIILAFDLFASSGLIVGTAPGGALALAPTPGPLIGLLIAHFFIGALFTAYLIFISRKSPSTEVRTQTRIITISIAIGLFVGGLRFASWFDLPAILSNTTIFAAPLFFIGVFYAITKYKLFKIKVIVTEIIIFAIWAFLFFRILLSQSLKEASADIILLIFIIILGIFLIKNVFKEVKQREELQILTKKLQSLNENLENKVAKRTEEVNESRLHTEAIIENLTLGLIEYDKDSVLLRINTAAEELLGVSRTKILKKSVLDFDDNSVHSLRKIVELTTKNNTGTSSSEATKKTILVNYPQERELQVITVPIKKLGRERTHQYVAIIRDVTRERMIDRSKSEFISIAAHQLRTPLSAIKWMMRLTLDGSLGEISKEQKDMFERGYTTNEKMIHIVNDLLNVSKIEGEELGYEFSKNNLAHIIEEVLKTAKVSAKGKPIEFVFKKPEEPIKPFVFDKEKISLVLQNLIENAIFYTPEGGTVTVSVDYEGKYIKTTVSDTGIGISKEDIGRVFDKFFRAKEAIHIKTDQSGLGLFIAKSIITRHGGSIDIASEKGRGTNVHFTLPSDENDIPHRTNT